MSTTGRSVAGPGESPEAVARIYLYGPRGGFVGSIQLDEEEARALAAQLERLLAGTEA